MLSDVMFEKFENDVMQRIIKENPGFCDELALQYQNCFIIRREFSGCGFFTHYSVTSRFRLYNRSNLQLGNLQADINSLKHGVGFVLFIREGLISMLEGFTYDENWPEKIKQYSFRNS